MLIWYAQCRRDLIIFLNFLFAIMSYSFSSAGYRPLPIYRARAELLALYCLSTRGKAKAEQGKRKAEQGKGVAAKSGSS